MDIDLETAKSRAGFGEERYEKAEFQAKVHEQFGRFEKMYEGKTLWVNVNANRSIDDIQQELRDLTKLAQQDKGELK